MLLVARVDVLCNGLGLFHYEVRALIIGHLAVNGAGWLLKAVIDELISIVRLIEELAKLTCLLCAILLRAQIDHVLSLEVGGLQSGS